MRQYYSNNKNYNAILESMAQIRQNQLNEQYGYYAEQDYQEGMYGDEEEMEERYMYEGEYEDEEDAQMEALAEMMDEALMELDDEDDEDNQMLGEAEEDDERRARRRARLRNALLIGAGLVATGGLAGAAMMNPVARGMITKGAGQAIAGAGEFAKGVGSAAYGLLPKDTRNSIAGGVEAGQKYVDDTLTSAQQAYSSIQGVPSAQGIAGRARDYVDATQAAMGTDVGARDYNRMALPANAKFDSEVFDKGLKGTKARRGASQQMVIDPEAQLAAVGTLRKRRADMIPGGL